MYLSRFIMDVVDLSIDDCWVKYLNGDRLDCRKRNLRVLNRTAGKRTWSEVNDWRSYGFDRGDYERLLEAQGGVCAICKEAPEPSTMLGLGPRTPVRKRKLAVDHCHDTGIVRGLVCYFCNNGLGSFRDDPDMLEDAADYIRKFNHEYWEREICSGMDSESYVSPPPLLVSEVRSELRRREASDDAGGWESDI